MAWVDLGGSPYYMHFLVSGAKVVFGHEGDDYWVDHLAMQPYIIPSKLMQEGRYRIPSYKNRLVSLSNFKEFDLKQAITQGIQEHIEYLGGTSESFALPTLRKWARMMTDPKKQEKAGRQFFKAGRGPIRNIARSLRRGGSCRSRRKRSKGYLQRFSPGGCRCPWKRQHKRDRGTVSKPGWHVERSGRDSII